MSRNPLMYHRWVHRFGFDAEVDPVPDYLIRYTMGILIFRTKKDRERPILYLGLAPQNAWVSSSTNQASVSKDSTRRLMFPSGSKLAQIR